MTDHLGTIRFGATSGFVGTNPETAANFCIALRSGGISVIVKGRFPRMYGPPLDCKSTRKSYKTSLLVG
jgi:hypothetical protein